MCEIVKLILVLASGDQRETDSQSSMISQASDQPDNPNLDVIEIRESPDSSSRRNGRRRRRQALDNGNDSDVEVVDRVASSGTSNLPEIIPCSPPRNSRRRVKPNNASPLLTYKDSVLIDLTTLESSNNGAPSRAENSMNSSAALQTGAMQKEDIVSTLLKALNCSICQFEMKNMTSTKCGHTFCEQCIKQAIRVNKKCPTCRKITNMKDLHRVFL
jgi:hypothetical protein